MQDGVWLQNGVWDTMTHGYETETHIGRYIGRN
jgi:hypothetical protein